MLRLNGERTEGSGQFKTMILSFRSFGLLLLLIGIISIQNELVKYVTHTIVVNCKVITPLGGYKQW